MTKADILIPIYYCDPSLFIPIETCLSTLQACYPGFKPTLWDDGSPLELPPHWDTLGQNPANMGYTYTVNRLLEQSEADVLIVCNDDVEFHPGCLDRFFTLEDDVIASPADTASGNLDGFGCLWGMTRATYGRLGPLDERMRHFFSDADYGQRAARLGMEVRKWRDITVRHPESTTYKLLGNKEELLRADEAAFNA